MRKHSYKADNSPAAAKYHPDTHQTCTIFAGTVVHQVSIFTCVCLLICPILCE